MQPLMFKRSLAQAFPQDYANAIEVYRRPSGNGVVAAVVFLFFCAIA